MFAQAISRIPLAQAHFAEAEIFGGPLKSAGIVGENQLNWHRLNLKQCNGGGLQNENHVHEYTATW